MTSSIRNFQPRPGFRQFRHLGRVGVSSGRPRAGRGGFTLVEMLVIIGIILALLAILLPSVGAAWKRGQRTRMQLDLQTIATALELYKQDHGDYPRVYVKLYGAWTLGQALIGPYPATDPTGKGLADGADGPGFRTRPPVKDASGNLVPQGRVYGPYLDPSKWTLSPSYEILDRYGLKPILYYPAYKPANINVANGFIWEGDYPSATGTRRMPRFNSDDNAGYLKKETLQRMMGDKNSNGMIDGFEQPAFDGDFLLWSAGPDLSFGPTAFPDKPVAANNRCDDVANFPRQEY